MTERDSKGNRAEISRREEQGKPLMEPDAPPTLKFYIE